MAASLNPYISQFGKEFDAEKSSQYRMAIQFALGGLSYALLDTKTKTLVALECYQSDLLADSNDLFRTLERALESKGVNNRPFQSATCLVNNRICILVPEPLFDEADRTKHLEFAYQIPDGYISASERLETTPCYNVFAWPKTLNDMVLSRWNDARIQHSSTVFIDTAMKAETKTGVFVQVNNRDFDMLVKKNGNLSFFNNFKFVTKEDFAYFLLFAMEQNGMEGQDTPVSFSGLIRPASEIIDLCGRYIKDISFVEDPHKLQISNSLQEVPFPYYHLFYQALR